MREKETQGTKWGTARPGWARSWLTVVIVAAVVVGLTVASAGAIAGSGEAKQGQYDELLVTDHCDEETNHLSVENPNGEPVELMLSWSTDQQSIQLQSSESLDTEIQSETTATASDDSDSQTTAYSLSTTVPPAENVTFVGLADGTYELSATADGEDVPLEHTEITLECGSDGDETISVLTSDQLEEHVAGETVGDTVSVTETTDEDHEDDDHDVKVGEDEKPDDEVTDDRDHDEEDDYHDKEDRDEEPAPDKHVDETDDKGIIDKITDPMVNVPMDDKDDREIVDKITDPMVNVPADDKPADEKDDRDDQNDDKDS
ncbi:hypothetical protein [Natrialba swarupiae]|uniref:Uncharacterized protein n=1 Tax=Natrialba swarupiae TaxID=2448032 RepID=A0A5D5AR03_9EURY|nr:hypothetical protein [Natrialba swarupiae]TYT63345.1 hypothetical protein FYC77_04545 [Natrialba swarupiae]